jgi:hypothetical protein
MAARLTPRRLHCGARVTRLRVARDGVRAVEYESGGRQQTIEPAAVANTLPITLLVRMLEPAPPEAVLAAARRLRLRDFTLVALFLDQPRVSDAACTYFPQRELPFTRAHEPRNRSGAMSPPGKTSLVVEFPCFEGDAIWRQSDRALVSGLVRDLDAMGLVRADRIEASAVIRHRKAYPVYSTDYRHLSGRVLEHLSGSRTSSRSAAAEPSSTGTSTTSSPRASGRRRSSPRWRTAARPRPGGWSRKWLPSTTRSRSRPEASRVWRCRAHGARIAGERSDFGPARAPLAPSSRVGGRPRSPGRDRRVFPHCR